jgi:hypothetical protein
MTVAFSERFTTINSLVLFVFLAILTMTTNVKNILIFILEILFGSRAQAFRPYSYLLLLSYSASLF